MSSVASTSGLTTPNLTKQASNALAGSAAAGVNAAGAGTSGSGTIGTAAQLSSNEQTFLKLLMTQIKNQDPTSPMDTNQFTSELVQFSSVEQQINTNTSLTSLIQLTQSGQLLQSSSLVGHKVLVNSPTMPVQNGAGQIQFTATKAEPVTITVYNALGAAVRQDVVTAAAGPNTWNWNAVNAHGTTMPDGAYKVSATTQSGSAAAQAVPFSVVGLATGLTKSGSSLNLQIGALSTDVSTVQSILN